MSKRPSRHSSKANPSGSGTGNAAPPVLSRSEKALFYNLYTAITSARAGARPRLPLERGNEEKTQLKPFDRLEAIAIGRDLNRNNPKAITIIEQRKVLTLGKVRAQFNTSDDDWNEAADKVFNRYFARDCYHEYPAHLVEIAQMVEAAKMREGDILLAYDDFLLDTGKLLIWEADQLVTVNKTDWDSVDRNPKWRYTKNNSDGSTESIPFFQEQGVICDQYKRVVGYIVSALHLADEKRTNITLPIDDVLIIPSDCARLVSNRFRVGQRRGVPSLLPVAAYLADIDEMLKSELLTAKMRSKIMAWVKRRSEAGADGDQEALVAEMLAKMGGEGGGGEGGEGGDGDGGGTDGPTAEVVRQIYRKIEEATGGMTEYLDDDDEIEIPNIDRPNLDTASFYDSLGDSAGASQGLARGFTRMSVASSYTAHRGETCMTDRHIKNHQKKHEHDWLDWLAEKVVRRAVEAEKLAEGPEDWEYMISWEMPRPDAIDPEKEARADSLNMKNGKITLRDIVGPGWRRRLKEFAEQLDYARALKLPLAIFETVAGAIANAFGGKTNKESEDDES